MFNIQRGRKKIKRKVNIINFKILIKKSFPKGLKKGIAFKVIE
jgi:hypothetical protein